MHLLRDSENLNGKMSVEIVRSLATILLTLNSVNIFIILVLNRAYMFMMLSNLIMYDV